VTYRILGNNRTWIYTRNNATLAIHNNALYVTSAVNIVPGKVQHIVVVRSADNKITFYIDGAVSGTPNQALALASNGTSSVRIGANDTYSFYSGNLGRVALYNYVLSADRVTAHYLAGLNGTANKKLLMGAAA
jgi:hypothetical protein